MLSLFSTNFHVLPNRQQAFDFLTMLTKLQFFTIVSCELMHN